LPLDSKLPRLVTTSEVAALFRTSPDTVRYWRHEGTGPAGFKVGKNVLYEESVVLAWMEELRRSEQQQSPFIRRSA
jgi:DNA-binding transcriptional MerR regulator